MDIPSPRRILVVRRDNIGDLVCTTPLLHALRESFPGAHIAVLVNSYNQPVLLGNPDVNEIFAYEKLTHRNGLPGKLAAAVARLGLVCWMRRRGFDLAILAKPGYDPHGLRMARWSGARRILGFAPPNGESARGLSDPIEAENAQALHEVEVVAQLGKVLGINDATGKLQLFPDPVMTAEYRRQLDGPFPERRWLALHISARELTRQWPADKFVALIEELADLPRLGFALFWSPGAADNPTHPGDDDKAAEILRRTRAHAVGVGLPVVALFENSDAKKRHWYPWRVEHCLLQPASFAVDDIEVTAVAQGVRRLLTGA